MNVLPIAANGAWNEMLSFVVSAPSDTIWTVEYDEFEKILKALASKNSGPGPDGIPYSVWYANPQGRRILFDMYIEITKGKLPPTSLLSALLFFSLSLPKAARTR